MNIKKICILSVAFLMAFMLPQTSFAQAKTGQEIAQLIYDRDHGDSMVTYTTMVLKDKKSKSRTRKFYTYRKDYENGDIKNLIRFEIPSSVKDTGLLTLNSNDGTNKQWMYLPALDSVRRISGERKGGRFVGSDLYYEDLQDRKVEKDTHKYLRQEKINDALCDVIESIPVSSDNSTYSKRLTWMHPQTHIPIRVDFYKGKKNTPAKRMVVKKIDKIQGLWTVTGSEFEDLKSGHKTILQFSKVVYNKNVPDFIFSQSGIKDASREIPFRP